MKARDLISQFERMFDEHWSYEMGAAREGVVDCSGAFVYAFNQFGQSIPHGSNSIARENALNMTVIEQAKPGWAAFKRRLDDGEPEKYRGDGWGNFYHIGLVSADGGHVLNAKGINYGFCCDDIDKGGWAFACPLTGVTYEENEPVNTLYRAKVITKDDPLRVRESPVTGKVIGHVPKDATVDVIRESDGWLYIRYGELTGYASGEFLSRISEPSAPSNPQYEYGMTPIITDDAGNTFVPVGGWTVHFGND